MDFSKYKVSEPWIRSDCKDFYVLDRRKIKKLKRKYHLVSCSDMVCYVPNSYYVQSSFAIGKGTILIQKISNKSIRLMFVVFNSHTHVPLVVWFLNHTTPAFEFYISEKEYLIDKLKN